MMVKRRLFLWIGVALGGILAVLLLQACLAPTTVPGPTLSQAVAVSPTAVPTATVGSLHQPTRTRLPTLTPMPTRSPTPTYTPTSAPSFPAAAVVPAGWPALPADLYFLRGGALWRWPAAGGEPQQVAGDGVVAYRITPDGQRVVYLTAEGQYYSWDEGGPVAQLLATTGYPFTHTLWLDQFDLTPDGRYLVYMAWEEPSPPATAAPAAPAPTLAPPVQGTLYAVDLDGGEQSALGVCASEGGVDYIACEGLLLSPDGRQVAYMDTVGLWVAQVPAGEPRLLAAHVEQQGWNDCGSWSPLAWSPDTRWLLVGVGCWEGHYVAIAEVSSGVMHELPGAFCYVECYIEATWEEDTVVVATAGFSNTLYLAHPLAGEEPPVVQRLLSPEQVLAYAPRSAHSLPDGRVAFAHFRDAGGPEAAAGIYALSADGSLEQIVPLAEEHSYCRAYGCWSPQGSPQVLWPSTGSAFLYLDIEVRPALLGLTDGSALWDVRELLRGAGGFRWGGAGH